MHAVFQAVVFSAVSQGEGRSIHENLESYKAKVASKYIVSQISFHVVVANIRILR
ncbi:hypothetical protein KP509_34G049800 [Ceratopteris richardii]|uniref:Uncharacterized protein n=1 Tax=Ceratopteris richardii TaxID=49495 RepID=A0A8T2QL55_CERRI|nr:hypothetical protein KP509_34G049800 [Ceratopteris richardii]